MDWTCQTRDSMKDDQDKQDLVCRGEREAQWPVFTSNPQCGQWEWDKHCLNLYWLMHLTNWGTRIPLSVSHATGSVTAVLCLYPHLELTTFNKGLHTLPTTKKAGTPQSGFPLCLPITAVSFCTQLNNKDFLFFLLQLYHTKQDVTTLSNWTEMHWVCAWGCCECMGVTILDTGYLFFLFSPRLPLILMDFHPVSDLSWDVSRLVGIKSFPVGIKSHPTCLSSCLVTLLLPRTCLINSVPLLIPSALLISSPPAWYSFSDNYLRTGHFA